MNRNLRWLCVIVWIICFVPTWAHRNSFADAGAKERGDVKSLEGTWDVIAAEEGGNKIAEKVGGMKISFTRDTMTIRPRAASDDPIRLKYQLHDQKNPKEIDTTHELEPGKPISQLGIYELDGDKLKLCLEAAGKGRPAKFETNPGGSMQLFVLKRAGKAKGD